MTTTLPRIPRLVAIDLPGGPDFVDALRRTWDAGDAAWPLDQRLPDAVRRSLVEAIAPSAVIGPGGDTAALDGGRPVEPGDALVVATSGSTGAPRGVVLTHDAVAASAAASCTRLGVTPADHWLACLPLSHVGGLSVVTRALHAGCRLTVLPGFDAAAVAAVDATFVSLVPTTLQRVDPARYRTILVGGARPPVERPPNVVTTYGMTESGSGVVYDGVPLDGVDVRIVDDEIHLRCPMLLRAYRDGSVPLRDGWFPTGDLGHWVDHDDQHDHDDEFGDTGDGRSVARLVVDGRRSDLVITGGENVWPDAVEDALRDHPALDDLAVAGTPDPEWGQVVTVFVVAPDGAPSLDELRDHARDRLAPFALPRRVIVVDRIPRTALGKPARSDLTEASPPTG